MTNEQIIQRADEMKDYLVKTRRELHRHPEPSGEEHWTCKFLLDELKDTGLPIEMVDDTSFIATFDTGKPGPHIVLRADIDALPMQENENNLKGARNCISENPKAAHMCGHDAHMAMLLASIKIIIKDPDQIGVFYFCFEEGEETGLGWPAMLAALEKKKVDTCWAIHVYAGLESGKVCLDGGPRMAGAASTTFTVVGKGGHGSRPDMAVNPVFCAAQILTNVATCWANQITAGETVTLGITTIQGGVQGNIIPDTADVNGTLRFFNMQEGTKAVEIFKKAAEHTAAMANCHIEFNPNFGIRVFPVVNDPECAAIARESAAKVLPEGSVVSCDKWYASDSYSRYTGKYKGVYAHLGLANPAYGSGAAHHNNQFDVDESILPLGVKATLAYVKGVQEKFKS